MYNHSTLEIFCNPNMAAYISARPFVNITRPAWQLHGERSGVVWRATSVYVRCTVKMKRGEWRERKSFLIKPSLWRLWSVEAAAAVAEAVAQRQREGRQISDLNILHVMRCNVQLWAIKAHQKPVRYNIRESVKTMADERQGRENERLCARVERSRTTLALLNAALLPHKSVVALYSCIYIYMLYNQIP